MKFVHKSSMKRYYFTYFLLYIFINSSSAETKQVVQTSDINHLKFLDEYDIPFNKNFKSTSVGGLSGIDYNPSQQIYYLISDDRSQKNPARFYKAKIIINKNKIDSVYFFDVRFFKNNVGKLYPNTQQDPSRTPDPEAMRYNPTRNTLIWSSEGERIVTQNKIVLENPAVTEISADGNYIDTFTLPPQLRMRATESGPRQNGVFEGVTFADNYKTLLVSVEEPLFNDGSRAGIDDSTGIVRIIKFNAATRKPVAQYAYTIDPVTYPASPVNAFKLNGISDILLAGKNRLLVIERSYSTGRLQCSIKVYLADISNADNINNVTSLKHHPSINFVSKKLLLNMDSLGIYIDNIEGVTFGPRLSNGKRSLIFISDNNFNFFEKTQLLLFEID